MTINFRDYINSNNLTEVKNATSVHFYSVVTGQSGVRIREDSIVIQLAKRHCPQIYQLALDEGQKFI